MLGCAAPHQDVSAQNTLDIVPELIDTALDDLVKEGQVAGVSTLIYKNGRQVYYGEYGHADLENDLPIHRDTIFHIYSMTKPITAAALMRLYEQGKFELDDPIEKHLPEFENIQVYAGEDENGEILLEPPIRLPTIRDLCMHAAGIYIWDPDTPSLQKIASEVSAMSPDHTLEEATKLIASVPLASQPGMSVQYGFSTTILARLIEVLTGEEFSDHIQTEILDPLGMENTTYFVPVDERENMAQIYNYTEDGVLEKNTTHAYGRAKKSHILTPGGTGLLSTIDDYMALALMYQNEGLYNGVQLLKPETVRLMATDHLSKQANASEPYGPGLGFGLNFAVRTMAALPEADWQGEVGEFYWQGWAGTAFWIDPMNDITSVIMVQVLPYDGKTARRVRNAIYLPKP